MSARVLRSILIFMVVAALSSVGYFPTDNKAQASTLETYLGINAPTDIIGVIFTQPVDPTGKLFLSSWLDPDGSDYDAFVWDNFTLITYGTVAEIDWVGGFDPLKGGLGGPVVDFSVRIYPSNAPGTEPAVAGPPLAQYMTGGNAGQTAIGTVGGIPMYSYAYTLPAPLVLLTGVKYWVQIKAYQQGSSPDWGIAGGSGGNSSHYRWGAGAGGDSGYRTVPGDAAFSVLGPVPDTPTDIAITNYSAYENNPVNTVIGELSAADPDPFATFTFSFTCATPGADDGSFNILGASLRTSAVFDYETKAAYDICIRVTDQNALTFDKNFIISVINIIEAPALVYAPLVIR